MIQILFICVVLGLILAFTLYATNYHPDNIPKELVLGLFGFCFIGVIGGIVFDSKLIATVFIMLLCVILPVGIMYSHWDTLRPGEPPPPTNLPTVIEPPKERPPTTDEKLAQILKNNKRK